MATPNGKKWARKENTLLKRIYTTAKDIWRISFNNYGHIEPSLAARLTTAVMVFETFRLTPKENAVQKDVKLEQENLKLFPIYVSSLLWAINYQQLIAGQKREMPETLIRNLGDSIIAYGGQNDLDACTGEVDEDGEKKRTFN